MRYRLMATYQGQPYEAGIGPSEGDVVLFAACPPPEDLGFEPATGHWRKQLRIADVQALWESRPTGTFRGEPCIILDDLGDRLHIAFLGHDGYLAERLGYWQVDRGVFELITPHDEVVDLVEERTDYPPRSAATSPPAPVPAPGMAQAAGFGSAPGLSPGPGSGFSPAAPDAALSPATAVPGIAPAAPDTGFGAAFGDPGQPLTSYAGTMPGLASPPGVALPPYEEPPLPLEAAALRATSAAARHQPLAPEPTALAAAAQNPAAQNPAVREPAAQEPAESARRRRAAPRRLATQRIFCELADLAAIPAASYAVGTEVEGAMCLLQTERGYEVFNAAGGARHEVRFFDDEESAYFYLFGVLAAEAVRTGGLVPRG
jgi:hypothetical protein